MSERQQLAEHGTHLCIAALGIIAGGVSVATALVPVAVLTLIGYEKWEQCDRGTVRRALRAAEEALRGSADITDADVSTAAELLRESRGRIRFEPSRMSAAVASGDLEGALLREVFGSALPDLDPGPRTAISLTLAAAFDVFRQNPRYREVFTQAMVMDLLSTRRIEHSLLEGIREDTAATRAMVEKLVSREEERARDAGIREGMLIALARRYAEGNPSDFDAALRGLERALEVAAEEKRRGQLPANTDDAVNAVLSRADALNDEGRIDDAAALIAEEKARAQAGLLRILDKGIAQAVLVRDADAACAYELEKLAIETPDPAAQRATLKGVYTEWYERGRDAGLNFDLEVAIALAREGMARGTTADERASAANDLGAALWTLGAREAGSVRLQEAVASCHAAIKDISRHRAPLLWARAHMNLGNALWSLGSRSAERAILEDAVSAFVAALQEYRRDCAPTQWAKTQMNLGNALWALGSREAGVERIELAIMAYRAALEEFDVERFPFEWATAKSNLGIALTTLGEREIGPERFQEAVAAYNAALDVFRRDSFPLKWANTQMNLGTALAQVGQRQGDPKGYERAVVAFRSALSEYTRDKAPFDWARIQANLGTALRAAGERDSDTERLEEAVAAFRAALEEYTHETAPLQWAGVQMNLGTALKSLGERQDGTEQLEAAGAAYEAALQQWTRERVPLQWAMIHGNLAGLSLAFHRKTGDAAHLAAAREHAEAARGVYAEAGAGQYLAQVEGILAEIEALAAAP